MTDFDDNDGINMEEINLETGLGTRLETGLGTRLDEDGSGEDESTSSDSNQDPLLKLRAKEWDEAAQGEAPCYGPKCLAFFFLVCTVVFFLLWLSESQFSEGVLRLKYEGETCGVYLMKNKICAPGFDCIAGKCQKTELRPSYLDGMDGVDGMSNIGNFTESQCPPCPAPRPCPAVRPNLVTYFDFNEKPNHWIDPGPHGYFKIAHHLSYGACKELCARSFACRALNYQGAAEMCCLMDQPYYAASSFNSTWNAATKIR